MSSLAKVWLGLQLQVLRATSRSRCSRCSRADSSGRGSCGGVASGPTRQGVGDREELKSPATMSVSLRGTCLASLLREESTRARSAVLSCWGFWEDHTCWYRAAKLSRLPCQSARTSSTRPGCHSFHLTLVQSNWGESNTMTPSAAVVEGPWSGPRFLPFRLPRGAFWVGEPLGGEADDTQYQPETENSAVSFQCVS